MESKEVFNYTVNAQNISKNLYNRLLEIKEKGDNLFVCDRINDNISFIQVYKDALFHYVDGVILCERIFKDDNINYELRTVRSYSDKDTEIYKEFSEFVDSIDKETSDINEVNEKLKCYEDAIKNMKHVESEVELPYLLLPQYSNSKILLKNISEIKDETLSVMADVMADNILSFFQTMFYADFNVKGITIKGIEYESFIDIVAILI